MDNERARALLEDLRAGRRELADVLAAFAGLATQDLGVANLDHHRELRCGFPEVVYGAGKTPEQLVAIVGAFRDRQENALATRLTDAGAAALSRAYPDGEFDPLARTFQLLVTPIPTRAGRVAVVSAGTSDEAVAREALLALRFFGYAPERLTDVGVAGVHRLLAHTDVLRAQDVVIVVAGMEGALPSVVGGLVSAPVIAVPTSVGYGAGTGGFAALFGMLSSCASGVTVCNIDNGFGAACAASRILARLARED